MLEPNHTAMSELRCGVLVDGTGAPSREDMSVLLEGDTIVSVQPWRDRSTHQDSTVVDLRECTVTPGLIDAHTHLCWGPRQSPAWSALGDDPSAIVTWGLASGAAALTAGITTVVDCGSPRGLALTVRNLVSSGLASGPRVLAAGEAITTTAGHGDFIGTTADTAAEMVGSVRGLVGRGADLIKLMVTGGATDPHTNRRQSQYSEEQLVAAIDDAHRLGRKVVGHANATTGIVASVAAGIDIVAHCNWLGTDPGTIELHLPTIHDMARRGTYVDLNIEGARRPLAETDGKPLNWPPGRPDPTNRWELLTPLRQAGVQVYLSSDAFGPSIGSFPSYLAEAAAEWGYGIERLIAAVTSIPARAFNLKETGVIQPGRLGDLAVFPGDLRTAPQGLRSAVAVYQRSDRTMHDGLIMPPRIACAHQAEARAQLELIHKVFDELD